MAAWSKHGGEQAAANRTPGKSGGPPRRPLGETSKFNFCGPVFPHSPTESNYIVCDFCRNLAEQSRLSI